MDPAPVKLVAKTLTGGETQLTVARGVCLVTGCVRSRSGTNAQPMKCTWDRCTDELSPHARCYEGCKALVSRNWLAWTAGRRLCAQVAVTRVPPRGRGRAGAGQVRAHLRGSHSWPAGVARPDGRSPHEPSARPVVARARARSERHGGALRRCGADR
ncbi:hypothetical protein T492DRAFT_111441 [Pavlovales sp. CCMP2436]|nr:hypothetical protein T492DRAFT_111441 [Pavlovales sp. CCMP2436]